MLGFILKRKICFPQVKAANKLLKTIPQSDGRRRIDGVPVFSAQNLDIAIATADGIKWCVLCCIKQTRLTITVSGLYKTFFYSETQLKGLHLTQFYNFWYIESLTDWLFIIFVLRMDKYVGILLFKGTYSIASLFI